MQFTRGHSQAGGGEAGTGTGFGSATRASTEGGLRGGHCVGNGGAGPPHLSEHAFAAL
jgi:hypothetical protein